jgi:hypothetical protein
MPKIHEYEEVKIIKASTINTLIIIQIPEEIMIFNICDN